VFVCGFNLTQKGEEMKVLAKIDSKKYLCEISHHEIEQYLDLYFDKLKELKVGDEVDLGDGYRHFQKTKSALDSTQDFFKKNIDNIKAITNAMLLVQSNTDVKDV